MKKQILSVLLVAQVFSNQAFMPVKDIALTAIPVAAIIGGGYSGYSMALDSPGESHLGETIFLTSFFSLFAAGFTASFTIPYTLYYKAWKANNIVKKVLQHDLFLQYDLSEIEHMSLDLIFETLNTKWDAYPLASSFDMLSEWSKKIKEAIVLYSAVKYTNNTKSFECDEKITQLRTINNVLVSVRDRIKNSDTQEFDRQMKVFLKEKQIEETRKLERAMRLQNLSASTNFHYVHHR